MWACFIVNCPKYTQGKKTSAWWNLQVSLHPTFYWSVVWQSTINGWTFRNVWWPKNAVHFKGAFLIPINPHSQFRLHVMSVKGALFRMNGVKKEQNTSSPGSKRMLIYSCACMKRALEHSLSCDLCSHLEICQNVKMEVWVFNIHFPL